MGCLINSQTVPTRLLHPRGGVIYQAAMLDAGIGERAAGQSCARCVCDDCSPPARWRSLRSSFPGCLVFVAVELLAWMDLNDWLSSSVRARTEGDDFMWTSAADGNATQRFARFQVRLCPLCLRRCLSLDASLRGQLAFPTLA